MLSSILAITCTQSIDPNLLIEDALVTNDFCSPMRAFNVRRFFGKNAEQKFVEYCDVHFTERVDELEFNNYNIAQLLDINESDLDAFVLACLDGNAPNGNVDDLEPLVIENIQQTIAPKVINSNSKVTVAANDKQKTPGVVVGRKNVSKTKAILTLGASTIALLFLANKLRKL